MLTSLSEQSTPAELSMKSVLIRPPCVANSMRPAWLIAKVGALADHLGAHVAGIDAQRVVGRIADLRVGLVRWP